MPDLAYITLALTPGIGRLRLEMLLARYESAEAVLGAPSEELAKVPSMSTAAAAALAQASPNRTQQTLERLHRLGGVVLVPGDSRYPERLAEIPDAPTLLFALGRLEQLRQPAMAIVGSRMHTRYGSEVCRFFGGGAARAGLVVVSGMARGLDAVAHQAALDAGGATIGVLGNGLGVVYPSANERLYRAVAERGCLLTEFPPGERPNAGSFPRRNRLISGLARVTLVVEARERSGALITVDCALRQGRDVMVVPGPITSPTSLGCNRLLQHGAKPALGLRDVFEEYGLDHREAVASLPNDLTTNERRVLDVLGQGFEHVDEMARHLEWAPADTLAALTSLEIRGLVTQEPGKVFRAAAPWQQPAPR